jgi:hypothetical protein
MIPQSPCLSSLPQYFPVLTFYLLLQDTIPDYSAHDCQISGGLAPLMLQGNLQMFMLGFS